jgi:hypothetical protein
MAVLGILTCEILELEFAQLLGDDTEITAISVLADSHSARLIELLEGRKTAPVHILPHPHAFIPEPGETLEVLVKVLALGLHRNRKVLRNALGKSYQALRPHIDVLLLGYGLCGGALEDAATVLDIDLPLYQPMDGEHPVDDCVALCLGGRERYYNEQRKMAGTYFLTPGWSRHWQRMLDTDSDSDLQPGLKRLLSAYERGLLVDTPVLDREELQRRGAKFRDQTGLRVETQTGTLSPLTEAWDGAKATLRSMAQPDSTGTAR